MMDPDIPEGAIWLTNGENSNHSGHWKSHPHGGMACMAANRAVSACELVYD